MGWMPQEGKIAFALSVMLGMEREKLPGGIEHLAGPWIRDRDIEHRSV